MFSKSVASVVLGALVAASFVTPAAGQSPAPACPQPVPIEEVQEGMAATGYTVVRGTEPEPFGAQVLGVLNDALGPGRDMIVADLTSPAIESAGGIWAGMSGSPVYVGDRLLGAVGYGLSEEDSSIAGLTPAQDMLDILSYPMGDGAASVPNDTPESIPVTPSIQRRIEASEGDSTSGSLRALRVPLSVSGGRGSRLVNRSIKREGLPYIAYAGSSASGDFSASATGTLEPGDSFAGSFSYGDITVAEIGTAAVVCENRAIAFAHSIFPFFPQGATEMGANEADVLTIVDNPNFKLATIEALVGTVDQDRLAGVRALLDVIPSVVPVTSTIVAPDLGRTLEGETRVVVQKMVPTIANVHMVDSVDSAFDQVGTGSVDATWTITGTREGGAAWELTRTNMFASTDDIARDSFNELTGNLFALFYNGHEDVAFTDVHADVTVREALDSYTLVKALVSVNGGRYRGGRQVEVSPGDELALRVMLRPPGASIDGSEDIPVEMALEVPRRVSGQGYITVSGGGGGGGFRSCFYDGEYCAQRIAARFESFDALLEGLSSRRGNNSIVARLRIGRHQSRVVSRDRAETDKVVRGEDFIQVVMEGSDGSRGGREIPIRDRAVQP
ncbi:MAG TPA: SpoIVB peptidase S55 domain-containing protein [Actinomycetota bacterium]|nr:SpoIVB peptidase S55 domain-containing protein [Actinomycetota bacterium]